MKAAPSVQSSFAAHRAIAVIFLLIFGSLLHAASREPKAYAIAEITVTDPVAYKDYLSAVTPIVAHFGGKYIVRAGQIVPVEGGGPAGRFVIIEFPSLAVAQKFESSQQYRSIVPLRTKATRTRLFLVEGVPVH